MKNLSSSQVDHLQRTLKAGAKICFLTGAGLSVESGLRTFRGKDGHWTIGSDVYTPQEMATMRMYSEKPKEVWKWYLQRFVNYIESEPNEAHYAIAELQRKYSGQVELVTQNIDGLHRRAGSTKNIYEIHGDMNFVRCMTDPSPMLDLPEGLLPLIRAERYDEIWEKLACPMNEGELVRAHVLLFDECYNESYYKVDSAWQASLSSDILVAIGTTGMANIPSQIIRHHLSRGNMILAIDPHSSKVTEWAERSADGAWLEMSAVEGMREILKVL